MSEGEGILSGINDQFACWSQVVTGGMKTTLNFWCEAAFDLDGPKFIVGPSQEQVNFSAAAGAVEMGLRIGGCAGQQVLNHKPFPTGAYHWVGMVDFVSQQWL